METLELVTCWVLIIVSCLLIILSCLNLYNLYRPTKTIKTIIELEEPTARTDYDAIYKFIERNHGKITAKINFQKDLTTSKD